MEYNVIKKQNKWKKRILKLKRKIFQFKCRKKVFHLKCKNQKELKGNVLLSYLKNAVILKDTDEELFGHTNMWECREIARIFLDLGYNVDAINCDNNDFIPKKHYDVFFDIYKNLAHIKMPDDCIKILHITGSYPRYCNKKDQDRVNNLFQRKKYNVSPRRQCDAEAFDLSLDLADFATLIGNSHTLSTFPEKYQSKIIPVIVTPSALSYIKKDDEFLPKEKEFLWFAGAGVVHKGLDLLLDVFAKHSEWTLNVVGTVWAEQDFVDVYKKEIYDLPNVKIHGYMNTRSEEFVNIYKKCFCFIFPTCSEGISTAAVTALSTGLYPIISIDTGIDLPDDCGIYLKDCSIEEIEESIKQVLSLDDRDITEQTKKVQDYILTTFTRENFTNAIYCTLKNKGL